MIWPSPLRALQTCSQHELVHWLPICHLFGTDFLEFSYMVKYFNCLSNSIIPFLFWSLFENKNSLLDYYNFENKLWQQWLSGRIARKVFRIFDFSVYSSTQFRWVTYLIIFSLVEIYFNSCTNGFSSSQISIVCKVCRLNFNPRHSNIINKIPTT